MLSVLSITSVIFLLIALGRIVVWRGLFDAAGIKVLGTYVVNIALPALIFNALASSHISEVLQPGYLALYTLVSLIMFAGGCLVSRGLLGLTRLESALQGLGMGFSNSGLIGFPVLLLALPAVAPLILAHNVMIETLIMLPLFLLLAERARNMEEDHAAEPNPGQAGRGRALAARIFGRLVRNPIIWGMLAGIAVSLSGLALPPVATRAITMIAASSTAVSLIVIGGSLHGLSREALDVRVLSVVGGKLIVMPLLAAGLGSLARSTGLVVLSDELYAALVVSAAVPTLSIYSILGMAYGIERGPALALALGTALSFVTLSFALWAVGIAG